MISEADHSSDLNTLPWRLLRRAISLKASMRRPRYSAVGTLTIKYLDQQYFIRPLIAHPIPLMPTFRTHSAFTSLDKDILALLTVRIHPPQRHEILVVDCPRITDAQGIALHGLDGPPDRQDKKASAGSRDEGCFVLAAEGLNEHKMRAASGEVDVDAWGGRLASVRLVPGGVCWAREVGLPWCGADDVWKEDDLSGLWEVNAKKLFKLRVVARTDDVVVNEAFLGARMVEYAESVPVETVIAFTAPNVVDGETPCVLVFGPQYEL